MPFLWGWLGFQLCCVGNQSSLEYYSGQAHLHRIGFTLLKNRVKGSLGIYFFFILSYYDPKSVSMMPFASLLQLKDNCSHNGFYGLCSQL